MKYPKGTMQIPYFTDQNNPIVEEYKEAVKKGMKTHKKQSKEKELTDFEKKFGAVCNICHKRKGIVMTSAGAEGGRNSYCKCDNES